MNLKETYNHIADNWVKDHSNDTWWQEGTNHLLSLLPQGASILDVGCGGGHKTKYLLDKGFTVLGTDFSENMIKRAEKEVPEARFQVLDAYETDTLTKTFDCVFAQAMLLHIPKARVIEVLTKFKSVLKPGGLLYVAVKEIKADKIEEKIITENDYGYDYKRFFSFFSIEELEKDFKEIGLEILWTHKTESGRAGWLQIIGKVV
jgi:2-polyprenyl-3-methyl-5-hydroxy-6-metoxy-1,4-benzoquinol methylase